MQRRPAPHVQIPGIVLLAGILALGISLRVLFLGRVGYHADEMFSLTISSLRWPDFMRVVWNREANMVLYYALLHFWIGLGTDERIVRALSVILSVATLPAMYALGVQLFDRRVALIASLLLAVNADHIWAAQFARSYSLTVFLVTLSSLFYVKAIQGSSRRDWTAYTVTSVLAIYSHFFGALVVAAQWASLVFLPRRSIPWRQLAVSSAAVVLLSAPLVVFAVTKSGELTWVTKPNLETVLNFILLLTGEGGRLLLLAYLAACLMALTAGIGEWRSRGASLETWRYGLPLAWLIVPIILTVGVSAIKPVFVDRYLIICLPPLVLLAAAGISRIRSQAALAGALVVVTGLAIRGDFLPRTSYHDDENWQEATSYVLSRTQREDALIIYDPYCRTVFDFYRARIGPTTHPAIVFPTQWDPSIAQWEYHRRPSRALLERLPSRYHRVWLVLSHDDPVIGRSIQASLASEYRLATERSFSTNIIRIQLYTTN